MAHPSPSLGAQVTTPSERSRRWFLGTQAWVRVATAASGGALALVEQIVPPGAESPWHLHQGQDETLYVIEGALTAIVGGERWTLGPGGCAFEPRGVPHGFRVDGDRPARILLACTPGGGFDEFVECAGGPAAAPGFPPPSAADVTRLARLASEHGMEVLGPLPL